MAIKLGSKVRDIYTGFEGLAIAKTDWLYGCNTVAIQPLDLDKDGKVADTQWFDEQRVEVVKRTAPKHSPTSTAKTGGPRANPAARTGPSRR